MKLKSFYILVLFATFNSFMFAQDDEPFIISDKIEFQLTELSGKIISSQDTIFNSKVIYITLWGTWCPPCKSEIPTLINLHNKYNDHGLVIVGIAFERDESAELRQERLIKFKEEQKINYLILDGGLPQNFESVFPSIKNVEGLPIEILINRKGKLEVIRNSYGYSEVWAGRLEQEIKTLLKVK